MAKLTITSANSIFMLSIESVFPTPQQLVGFGVDEAFDTEPADMAEVVVGVDNIGVAGWVPRLVTQTITLLAASPSFTIFEDWVQAQDAIQEVLYASATVTLPSIGRKYAFTKGALSRYPALPNVRRTLQQRQFTIVWMPPGNSLPPMTSAPV